MNNFETARKRALLTQAEVAATLGIDRSTVAKWETDMAKPRGDTLIELAKLYGCTTDALLAAPKGDEVTTHDD